MISLSFLCAVVTKRFIYFSYPGKLPAFREKYHSSLLEDEWLVGITAENGCELRLITDELEKYKLFLGIHVATGGQRYGPIEAAQGVSFEKKTLADGGTEWVAEIASDDHKTLKRGRAIPRKMRPGETCFGGGAGVLTPINFGRMPSRREPMLGAMNALEEALEEAYRQNMARLGLEPYDEPPEGQDRKK